MQEVVLTYETPEGTEKFIIGEDRIALGRGSEAVYRFEDNGVSRIHASIYREDEFVWIIDENSTYGTFVNGEKVGMSGSPLHDGDEIKIGHRTTLKVEFVQKESDDEEEEDEAFTPQTVANVPEAEEKSSLLIPLAVTAFALLIVGASIVFIAVTVFGVGQNEISQDPQTYDDYYTDKDTNDDESNDNGRDNLNSNTTSANNGQSNENTTLPENGNLEETVQDPNIEIKAPVGKQYLKMSDLERNQYIAAKSMRIARIIGNQTSKSIPPLAVARIKAFTNAYAKRINTSRKGGCKFGDNLQATYERASKNAPFIVRAFNRLGIAPQIGLYLAMIESEHCVCLQSPTGPLGMFQFTRATGKSYGLAVRKGASPSNPDERCEPQPAALAAAKYMKFLTGRYGTGPSSIPLAIGSYNSGEGGLSKNLKVALESNEGLPRDFWSMIANGEKLSKQFQAENFKYVPKFFAAAIVGENPRDFGVSLQPLSTYTK